jgi:hypothetical protein
MSIPLLVRNVGGGFSPREERLDASIAMTFPNATMAGAEAPAYNGRDVGAAARPE